MAAQGMAIFREVVRLISDAIGVALDEVRCDAEYAQTTGDLDLGSWTIPAGCVCGRLCRLEDNRQWHNSCRSECAVTHRPWQAPDRRLGEDGWVIQVDGRPRVTLIVASSSPPDLQAPTIDE